MYNKLAEYAGGFNRLKSITDDLDAADSVDKFVLTYLHRLVDTGSTKRLRNVVDDITTDGSGAA